MLIPFLMAAKPLAPKGFERKKRNKMSYQYLFSWLLLGLFCLGAFQTNAQKALLSGLSPGVATSKAFPGVNIPPAPADAPGGQAFMDSVEGLSFEAREEAILQALQSGNLPDFLRQLVPLHTTAYDAEGQAHTLTYHVMPDYLAIGHAADFCRIPMGPVTAQQLADAWGMTLPTRLMVNRIYEAAEVKLAPVTYAPEGNTNETVAQFVRHSKAIDEQLAEAGANPGQLTGGTKKDVVLSNKIYDPSRPGHVVIYGWHRLSGEPIQPLTNIHVNTYVDYSHGIRLLANHVLVDGDTTTLRALLQDPLLHTLVSDEATPMAHPTYLKDPRIPPLPQVWAVRPQGTRGLQLQVSPDIAADSHHVFLRTAENEVMHQDTFSGTTYEWEGLPADTAVFVQLRAANAYGTSGFSEELAVKTTTGEAPLTLIVNGFDRATSGNSRNFSRKHARAMQPLSLAVGSATNEALAQELVALADVDVVDMLLGEESTVDETFSAQEQALMADYLDSGGRLLVSGAEIAWDLGHKGSYTDQQFLHEYLKAAYGADAPGGVSGAHYALEGIADEILAEAPAMYFDNGTHGTYDVRYADALLPQDGARAILRYQGVATYEIAGIRYEGRFGADGEPGKLVYLGLPLETVYPEAARHWLMQQVMEYLLAAVSTHQAAPGAPSGMRMHPVYGTGGQVYLQVQVPARAQVQLSGYALTGQRMAPPVRHDLAPGWHHLHLPTQSWPAGLYVCRLRITTAHSTQWAQSKVWVR